MRIMCDTNILLDVLLDREPFAGDSASVLKLCEEGKAEGFVTASCVTDIFYLVQKYLHSHDLAYNAIGKILEILKIAPVTNNDVLTAYQARASDFEDYLLAVCAKAVGCKCIITRNKPDFKNFGLQLYEPAEFIKVFGRNKAIPCAIVRYCAPCKPRQRRGLQGDFSCAR